MLDRPHLPAVLTAMMRRGARPLLGDVGIVLLLLLLDLAVSVDYSDPSARPVPWTVLYVALGYAVLLVRRRWPRAVFVTVLVHCLLAAFIVPGYQPLFGLWLALFTLAVGSERRWAVAGFVAMAGPLVFTVLDELRRHPGADRVSAVTAAIVLTTGINAAVLGVGRWVRWSVRQRQLAAEHAAAEAARAERSRIALDLHDVVAHAVTLMVLQAGGAARLLRSDPARAEVALGHVQELGEQAVVELRRFLDLLVPAEPVREASAPSGLRDLAELVEQSRTGDVDVDLTVSGDPAPLDPGVEQCAYRVVQEALTNAARYADRQHPVQVIVGWQPSGVQIQVVNRAGRVPAGPMSSGRGILGMRERVRAVHGRIEAGPETGDRFLVDVFLPSVGGRLAVAGVGRP